jgi:hypothetical protein
MLVLVLAALCQQESEFDAASDAAMKARVMTHAGMV